MCYCTDLGGTAHIDDLVWAFDRTQLCNVWGEGETFTRDDVSKWQGGAVRYIRKGQMEVKDNKLELSKKFENTTRRRGGAHAGGG